MIITLDIDDELFRRAEQLTGVGEKKELVSMGLKSLIVQHSANRLAALGGTDPNVKTPPRRRCKK